MIKASFLPTKWADVIPSEVIALTQQIVESIEHQRSAGKTIYPPKNQVFNAFHYTSPQQCKVVLIGQDPYHGQNQAHGLSFSTEQNKTFPPSLRNIFKEYEHDLNFKKPSKGNLSKWAKEGVLLLNRILTVEEKKPKSHETLGWQTLTTSVVEALNKSNSGLVFILWGKDAQQLKKHINVEKHLVITAAHPAAELYSGGKSGFFGSSPFTKTNLYLEKLGRTPIDWEL